MKMRIMQQIKRSNVNPSVIIKKKLHSNKMSIKELNALDLQIVMN